MRKVIHPFRFRRQATVLAVTALIAVLFVAAIVTWNVGSPRAGSDQKLNPNIASQLGDRELRRSLQRIAEQARELRSASDARKRAGASARRRKAVRIKPFVIGSAVNDGKLAYARTSRTITDREIEDSLGALPTEVVIRDLATGQEQVVFRSRATTLSGLITRDGNTAFALTKLRFDRRGIGFDTSVLHVPAGSPTAKVIGSDEFNLRAEGFTYCGRLSAPVAMNEAGDLLVTTMVAACERSNEIYAEHRLVAPDGSDKPIALSSTYRSDVTSEDELTNGRLLARDPNNVSYGLRDIASGNFTPLVDGGVRASALAPDGTVAAVMDRNSQTYPRPDDEIWPFVVFPGGDPDRIIVASRMAGKIEHLKFCGENLYAVKRISGRSQEIFDFDLDIGLSWLTFTRAKYRVLAYDKNGALVGPVGDTPGMVLSAVGCDGAALELVAARGKSVTRLRYSR